MSRRAVFIGPNYPPEAVIRAIMGLSVNIYSRDFVTGVRDTGGNYITNLSVISDNISFTVVCTNPITGEMAELTSSSPAVRIVLKPGVVLPKFSGGSKIYGISPCCITMAYPKDAEDTTDVRITCADPVQASLSDNNLVINISDYLPIITSTIDSTATPTGVVAINGISTKNGGINIRGVGSVSVSVAGAEGGDEDV